MCDGITKHRRYTAYMGLYRYNFSGPIEAMDLLPSADFDGCQVIILRRFLFVQIFVFHFCLVSFKILDSLKKLYSV